MICALLRRQPHWMPLAVALFVLPPGGSLRGEEPFFDAHFRRGEALLARDLHVARLFDPPAAPFPGLTADASRAVREEVELRALLHLFDEVGDYRPGVPLLERFLSTKRWPLVESIARLHLGYYLWRTGQNEAARAQWGKLGYIDDWWLIGPFDNERGSGFARVDPPEREFDLAGSYTGKRNELTWRRYGVPMRGGILELSELLRPNEEALAYLVTHIHAETAHEVALRVGSSGSYAVWLNGVEVTRLDVERPLRHDQEAVRASLGAGWNRLLIETAQTKGPWRFRIRVTEPDGAPATGVKASAELPQGAALAAAQPGGDSSPACPLGAVSLLASATPAPETLTLLGWLHAERQAHDVDEHPDRDEYLRARELAPEDPILAYWLAQTYLPEITHSAEREENQWRLHMEQALALDPEFHRIRFELATYYLDRFENLTRAQELLAPVLASGVSGPRPAALAARILSARIAEEAALPETRAVEAHLATMLLADERLAESERRRRAGERARAEELIDAGLAMDATQGELRARRRALHLLAGDEERARAQLEAETAAFPEQIRTWLALADFDAARERWEHALAAVDRALAISPYQEQTHRRRGDLLRQLDRRDDALEAFRRSLELEPNQPKLREYVEYLDRRDSELEREFRVPAVDVIAAALARGDEENQPARILLDNQAVRIHQDGTTVRFHQFLAKITNNVGIRQFDYYRVPYAYGEQWVKVLLAKVHHPDGRSEEAQIQNRNPVEREGEYNFWSSAWVDLPPLEIGDVVEIEYRLEDLRQSFFGDYFGDNVEFGGTSSRDRTIYTVVAPPGKRLYFNQRGWEQPVSVEETPDRRLWRFELAGARKVDPEPAMPPVSEVVPMLEVSTFEDWNAFATWYYHLIRKQFESSPEIRAKVEELTRGLSTTAEKIRAIYEFVVTDVRYIAWEFGVHGFKPYNASAIFTRRFGDCKDKATLICTMLDELGIDAHPVLIYGAGGGMRGKEDFTLPLVHHFNHCIAWVPDRGDGSGIFLDGTAEHHSVDQLPSMNRGAKVLIVKEDGGAVTAVPWNRPDEFALAERVEVTVRPDGSALIEQENRFTGDHAYQVRANFEVEGQRKAELERIFARRFPGSRVVEQEASPLSDLNTPVRMTVKLEVPDYLEESGDGIKLPPLDDIFASTHAFGATATRGERAFDLLLGNPKSSELLVEIELPPGYEVAHLPESLHRKTPQAEFDFEASASGNRLSLRRSLTIHAPRVGVGEYAEFKRLTDEVQQFREERITLRKIEEVE